MQSASFARTALRAASACRSSRLPAYRAAAVAARFMSIKAEAASSAKHQALDASKLSITKTKSPKPLSKPEDLVFGREFTGACFPPMRSLPPPSLFYLSLSSCSSSRH